MVRVALACYRLCDPFDFMCVRLPDAEAQQPGGGENGGDGSAAGGHQLFSARGGPTLTVTVFGTGPSISPMMLMPG